MRRSATVVPEKWSSPRLAAVQNSAYSASPDAPVAQLDRALASGARGQRFESSRAHEVGIRRPYRDSRCGLFALWVGSGPAVSGAITGGRRAPGVRHGQPAARPGRGACPLWAIRTTWPVSRPASHPAATDTASASLDCDRAHPGCGTAAPAGAAQLSRFPHGRLSTIQPSSTRSNTWTRQAVGHAGCRDSRLQPAMWHGDRRRCPGNRFSFTPGRRPMRLPPIHLRRQE
jgi:hypothetical protein